MTELVTGKAFPNVVVTGIAMTTALATDAENTWKLLLDCQSGIRTLHDAFVEEYDLPVRIGAHLDDGAGVCDPDSCIVTFGGSNCAGRDTCRGCPPS